ncbi:MAG: isoprenyl transferase [Elusimicrobia bacterium]|nr:isoprenyl transferase [Elusimicrobiota bacterium]
MQAKASLASAEPSLDKTRLPKHIAVIMDGNGRWAKAKGLPRLAGHRAGVESVREIVRDCSALGVKYLTLYSFSTENWLRPKEEVGELMKLLSYALRRETLELDKNQVRLRAVGRIEGLPAAVRDELKESVKRLDNNTGLTLSLALNYGSRQELVDAVNRLIKEGAQEVSEDSLSAALYTAGLPDPDLVIRTSGEMRVSNFLLWQIAYAELYVTPVFWPDFRRAHLLEAIADFQRRERRFGGL